MARYSDSASPDEAVLIETDDFALVYDRQSRAFHKKLWNSSTKSWTTKVAPYSALVAKDGSTVWAEDSDGKTIASGEAGVDDASVIQSALNSLTAGRKWRETVILKGDFEIRNKITLPSHTTLNLSEAYLKLGDSVNDHMFYAEGETNIEIIGGKLDGNKANNDTTTYYRLLLFVKCDNLKIRGVEMFNGAYGITIQGDETGGVIHSNFEVTGCYMHDLDYDGLYYKTYLENCKAMWNYAKSVRRGFACDDGCKAVKFAHNVVEDASFWGIEAAGLNAESKDITIKDNALISAPLSVYAKIANVRVISNHFENCSVQIHVEDDKMPDKEPKQVVFADNTIDVGGGRKLIIQNAKDVIVANNYIYSSDYYGVDVLGGVNVKILNSRIKVDKWYSIRVRASGYRNSSNIEIKDCTTETAGDWDIYVENTDIITIKRNNILTKGIYLGAGVTNAEIKNNRGYATENSGTATFSGDGTTTQFSIAHGLVSTPTKVLVTPMTADAASDFYVTADDTYIYINYLTAPAAGTDNLKFSWFAEV